MANDLYERICTKRWVREDRWQAWTTEKVDCPSCGVYAGTPCQTHEAQPTRNHMRRVYAAQDLYRAMFYAEIEWVGHA